MTRKKQEGYTVVDFPQVREVISDILDLGHRKHMIHGLVHVDVTLARRRIAEYEAATGGDLSFTAFILTCLGRAVDRNKYMHAYRSGRNKLVLFDDVDVSTQIEIEMNGRKIPISHNVRATNKRSVLDIHQEIRRVQSEGADGASAPTNQGGGLFMRMPSFLRRLLLGGMFSSPHRARELAGTVMQTAVGMFGEGGGWGVPYIQHTLGITLGGIDEQAVVIDGRIEIRERLSMTVSFDHDIVDGAPAARFTQRFKDLIEAAYGLDDVG